MENLYNKEKKLETVLEKLKNLSSSPSVHGEELKSLYLEKNQLQSEKIGLESKYNNLLSKYNELKLQIKKMEDDQKKTKRIQDKFNQDIEISSKYFKQPYLSVLLKIISKISQFKIFKQQLKNNYIDRLNSSL